MQQAIEVARLAQDSDDVPVGAVVLGPTGALLASGHNAREALRDPTAHAEVMALREAAASLGRWRLEGCTLVVTLEPCTMCAGAVVLARLSTLVFGAYDPKAGAVGSLWDVVRDRRVNSRPDVIGGVLAAEAGDLLRQFFATHRREAT
jgi:tRNA(adenine34) deaminase